MAHQDRVPADEPGWRHPPFAAEISDDGDGRLLWGRGTIDDTGALAGLLEAVEAALADGIAPRHDVLLAFGHDEEVGGTGGRAIAEAVRERFGVPAFVLDEGGAIVRGVFPGVAAPLAVIGVSEKGIASVELTVEQRGGHASTPPKQTATERLAAAIVRLGRRPARATLPAPVLGLLEGMAPHASGALGAVLRRARLLRPFLPALLARSGDQTAAMVRTTRAVTRLSGSAADNVLAERARAIVNVRVSVDDTLAGAVDDIRRAIGDDGVAVRLVEGSEPSPVSPASGAAWDAIVAALASERPDVVPVPYVQNGATDSRWFARYCPHVYRFTPFEITAEQLATLHAIDENIGVDAWLEGVRILSALVRSL
jgi:carboxypeptidase PM20D1